MFLKVKLKLTFKVIVPVQCKFSGESDQRLRDRLQINFYAARRQLLTPPVSHHSMSILIIDLSPLGNCYMEFTPHVRHQESGRLQSIVIKLCPSQF